MSTGAATTSPTLTTRLAASDKFGSFAIVFSLAFTIIYTVCDQLNWPLFTYHPAVQRLGMGFEPPRSGEGPAVYWYGWLAMAFITAFAMGLAATALPQGSVKKIPSSAILVVPLIAFFILGWSLNLFFVR